MVQSISVSVMTIAIIPKSIVPLNCCLTAALLSRANINTFIEQGAT